MRGMAEDHEEPLLLITPNPAAMALLGSILSVPTGPETDIPVWEVTIPLRITQADLDRCMYGNGDLAQVGFIGHEPVAFPDPEMSISPFDDESPIDNP